MFRYTSELHKKDNTLDAVSVFRPCVVQFLKPAKLVFVWSYFINVSLHVVYYNYVAAITAALTNVTNDHFLTLSYQKKEQINQPQLPFHHM